MPVEAIKNRYRNTFLSISFGDSHPCMQYRVVFYFRNVSPAEIPYYAVDTVWI